MTKPKFRVVTYPNGVIVGWTMNNEAFEFAMGHFNPTPLLWFDPYLIKYHSGEFGFILNRKKA